MKRVMDILVSLLLLLVTSPILLIFCIFIYLTDYGNPLYVSRRVGFTHKIFLMFKLRSMVVNADNIGPETTKSTDKRITTIGRIVRKTKADELMQLINVFKGDMSLVGPRPNTINEVAKYSEDELQLILVKPGITDISSIIFSDEGEILASSSDPVADYDLLIRPWKYKFGMLYIRNQSVKLDILLCFVTFLGIFNKRLALSIILNVCNGLDADDTYLRFIEDKMLSLD